jgi:hypothetical protein
MHRPVQKQLDLTIFCHRELKVKCETLQVALILMKQHEPLNLSISRTMKCIPVKGIKYIHQVNETESGLWRETIKNMP